MQIVITGATGFIGSRLALACLERGHPVRALGRENNPAEAENSRELAEKGAQVILDPVTDRERMFEAVQDADLVFHLAAAQHEANVPDSLFWEVNVEGTRNMIDASVQAGVARFVHCSTIGVYQNSLAETITERFPLEPGDIYGVTKLAAEKVLTSYRGKLPFAILRISETYGPGDRRLLKLFKGIQKHMFFVIGGGKNLHHLIYVDDLIEGLFLAAESDKALDKAFVIAGNEAVTTNEMVKIVARQLETKFPILRAPLTPFLLLAVITEGLLRPLGIQPPIHRRRMDFFRKSFRFSGREASETLDFTPNTTFEDGVAKTITWYREKGLLS